MTILHICYKKLNRTQFLHINVYMLTTDLPLQQNFELYIYSAQHVEIYSTAVLIIIEHTRNNA